MTDPGKPRQREAQRKLRASERRDEALAAFCDKMLKQVRQSTNPRDRADAGYWADLAAYFRATEQFEGPKRRLVPTTTRLEFLGRALARVAALQAEEVAQLRSEGVSWQSVGEAVGITRQGAIRRWPGADARARELAAERESIEVDVEFERAIVAEDAESLRERMGGAL